MMCTPDVRHQKINKVDNGVTGHVKLLSVYFVTYGRFNNAVSNSDYKLSNGWMINPCRTVKLSSTALYAVPGPMSSSNQQVILKCFMLVFPKILLSSGCF
jgi:hypothetical protein